MGTEMTLLEAVALIESLDQEGTIYAEEPWTTDSSVLVLSEADEKEVVPEAERSHLAYFIEVFLAREFIDDWALSRSVLPSLREKCERLIAYARTDA